jgi:hypothetical protein
MVELTLDHIADLAGDWTDDSRASEQFREIIENEQTTTDEIEAFLHEAIDGSEQHHNRALQDLVNNIGRRLGFRVDHGIYQGRSGEIGYDGHWVSDATETETQLARTLDSYVGEQAEFDESKQVVVFEPGSLYELADPIKFESRVPYSLRYTELERLKEAETTDDIL